MLWSRLGPWFARATALRCPATGQNLGDAAGELPVEPEKPWGCGWFDSSLDLRQGLAVIEHQGIPLELAVQAMLAPDAVRH